VAYKGRPIPIQAPNLRPEDLKGDLGYLNQYLTQVTNAANLANGAVGPSVLPAGIDVAGSRITGLAAPQSDTDAISSGHAQSQFSAPTLQPKFDIGGSNALKGLTYLYGQQQATQSAVESIPSTYTGGNTINLFGLIVQFGIVASMGGGSSNSVAVTFPDPFPTACQSVLCSTTGPNDRITFVSSFSTTGATLANNGSGAGATWVAFGY
jgi:hypothetical protein